MLIAIVNPIYDELHPLDFEGMGPKFVYFVEPFIDLYISIVREEYKEHCEYICVVNPNLEMIFQ